VLGAHVLGGRVDEVAHQAHRLRHLEGFAHARRRIELQVGGLALRPSCSE
jgi:hypothetical protein